jgi:hypothetical protein
VLPFVPLETAPYEKSAQAWLDQPVKIGAVYLTLLPLPQLKFEKVAIGRDPQLKIGVARASPELTTLLEDRILLRSLDLENVTLPREFVGVLLRDKAARKGLGAQRVTAKGLKIDAQELGLPPLDLEAKLSANGALLSASFTNAEQRLSINVEPQGGKAIVDISSGTLPLPIGIDIGLTEFTGKGTASANELTIPNAEARAFGGRVFGNLRLRWSSGWSLDGELSVRQMDAAKIAGPLIGSGTVLGKGKVSMRGLLPERMVLNSQIEGGLGQQRGHDAPSPGQRLRRRHDVLRRDERRLLRRPQPVAGAQRQARRGTADRHRPARDGCPEESLRPHADRASRPERAGAIDPERGRHAGKPSIPPHQLSDRIGGPV